MPAIAKFNMKVISNLIQVPRNGHVPCVLKTLAVNCSGNPYDKDHDYKRGCRRAVCDIPPKKDSECPKPCERHTPKKNKFLHKIKLQILEGGSNFGTPFRKVKCEKGEKSEEKPKQIMKFKKLPHPVKLKSVLKPKDKKSLIKIAPVSDNRPGVQVSILGVETPVGQYLALLLKQCSTIKKLRLYEATLSEGDTVCKIAHDLNQINTNCGVQAFNSDDGQLERCLQNTDIVVMLENACISPGMSLEDRFLKQAPIVKYYADAISTECPRAFLIVCASPIDCMVPLIAEVFKETGWYDPKRLLGSMAVPEMRASTLAARALGLEPRYTRVPCVGGTEGDALVPLFSKTIEHFDFSPHNALMMTDAIRQYDRCKSDCGSADLGEAHALAKLVTTVSQSMLCNDRARIAAYVASDRTQMISPAASRYFAIDVALNEKGIEQRFELPSKLLSSELQLLDKAFMQISYNVDFALSWYNYNKANECCTQEMQMKTKFLDKTYYPHLDECARQFI